MIAIAGGKGGSGKTTTAVGLAWMLARRGNDPLVVDCDTDMPDLHHLLDGLQPGGIDRLAAGHTIEASCEQSPTAPGVRCLTAGNRSNVSDALARVTDWHDSVILDRPPGAGPDAVRPLRHAQGVALVSTDQSAAIADTVRTARTARELGTQVLGALIRKTASGSVTAWPDELPVLARVDSVDTPLEMPHVRAEWSRVAATELTGIRDGGCSADSNYIK